MKINDAARELIGSGTDATLVDDDDLVRIEGDDVSLVRWNHRTALVRDALHRFGGMAVWRVRSRAMPCPEIVHRVDVATTLPVGGSRRVKPSWCDIQDGTLSVRQE